MSGRAALARALGVGESVGVIRAVALSLSLTLGLAPLQCGSGEPDDAHYESPPEALYGLAEHFKKAGKDDAYRSTLKYLVERYPNSRFAVRAKNELEQAK